MSINYIPLSTDDIDLVRAAINLIATRYEYKKHHIGAAIRTKQGRIITGLHMDTLVRRAAICAESIALGIAITLGDYDLDTIVAVRRSSLNGSNPAIGVVSPCGFCRELLMDYASDIKVIIDVGNSALLKCDISDLLPLKYRTNQNHKELIAPAVYLDQIAN